jgi:hypothetical protein
MTVGRLGHFITYSLTQDPREAYRVSAMFLEDLLREHQTIFNDFVKLENNARRIKRLKKNA